MDIYVLSLIKDLGFAKSLIHPVLIKSNSELFMYDAGYPGQIEELSQEMSGYGLCLKDLTGIIISHHDHDHIGSLKDIKELNPEVEILASREETPYISGEKESLRLKQAEEYNKTLDGKSRLFGEKFTEYLRTINTCPVDRIIGNEELITEKLRVIATPGHTPGHISLLIEDKKIFLTGDALAVENDRLVLPNPQFTLDKAEALKSLEKIRGINPEEIICYHGGRFNLRIKDSLTELIEEKSVSS